MWLEAVNNFMHQDGLLLKDKVLFRIGLPAGNAWW